MMMLIMLMIGMTVRRGPQCLEKGGRQFRQRIVGQIDSLCQNRIESQPKGDGPRCRTDKS